MNGISFSRRIKSNANGDGSSHVIPVQKGERGFFTSYEKDGRVISYYGDNHPVYAGNVVKAMASAKDGYEHVTALFADELSGLSEEDQTAREKDFARLTEYLDEQLIARVVRVDRLTETIVDVIVHAPMQARKFHPGQFYRLQNYETDASVVAADEAHDGRHRSDGRMGGCRERAAELDRA